MGLNGVLGTEENCVFESASCKRFTARFFQALGSDDKNNDKNIILLIFGQVKTAADMKL